MCSELREWLMVHAEETAWEGGSVSLTNCYSISSVCSVPGDIDPLVYFLYHSFDLVHCNLDTSTNKDDPIDIASQASSCLSECTLCE